jgi:myosin heavy subunit
MSGIIPDGAIVWIKDPAKDSKVSFVKATVTKFTEGRGYTVKMSDGKERTVRAVDCAQANPDGMSAPDNCYLIHISESTILDNMRARFEKKLIYTYTSNILIVVNPFQKLPIYGNEHMAPYQGKPLGIVEPHSYAMAEEAYKCMLGKGADKQKGSQSLVVSGESGAGKTETNKHLLAYLAFRSKSETTVGDIATAIVAANPVLEAFGNAKTSRNNNSSRFGTPAHSSEGARGGRWRERERERESERGPPPPPLLPAPPPPRASSLPIVSLSSLAPAHMPPCLLQAPPSPSCSPPPHP